MRPYTIVAVIAAAMFSGTSSVQAQNFTTHACNDSGQDHGFLSHFLGGEQVCEVRTTSFPLVGGHLSVNTQNGGIEVIGEDRSDISLEAHVTARGGSQSEAADILHQISIETGGKVEPHGPRTNGNRNWAVSFRLHVPHHLAAELHTMNGGLALTAVDGSINGETTNGGLRFERLAGDVHLTTTNGAIRADLDGSAWRGKGLSASTTNGGITVSVPRTYSAHLVASTTNGGTSISLPVADQDRIHRHSIDTNLGAGGPTISFETTNGGISIQ